MKYKYAIVESGGGFDCSFGVGIQKALLEYFKMHPAMIRIGSSGSTITTSFFTANQAETGYYTLTEDLSDPHLVKKGKIVDEIDVEKLVKYIEKSLNLETLINSSCKAFIALTDYKTGNNKYFSNHDPSSKKKWFEFMKASMAIPLSFKKNIAIDGIRYSDGDIAAPLLQHIQKALELGADKIIAINNHSPGTLLNLNSLSILSYMLMDKYHRKALHKRIKKYLELEKKLEKFLDKIIFLAPPQRLPTTNFHNSKEAIKTSIQIGYEYALKNNKLKDFIS